SLRTRDDRPGTRRHRAEGERIRGLRDPRDLQGDPGRQEGVPAQDATLDARGSAVTDVLSLTPPRHRALGSLAHRVDPMGRTIPTYRLHIESILNDWMDYRRALREKDREVFDRLLNKSRQHSSAASYCAHIDPSILALLSVLLEMERDIETLKRERSSAARDSGPRA